MGELGLEQLVRGFVATAKLTAAWGTRKLRAPIKLLPQRYEINFRRIHPTEHCYNG